MDKYKRWLYSTWDSFVGGFAFALVLQLENLASPEAWGTATMSGVFYACVRGGLKAMREHMQGYRGGGNGQ